MKHTALDSPYDRNQMQTLFVMLSGVRQVVPAAKPRPVPALAIWWRKAKSRIKVFGGKPRAGSGLNGRLPGRPKAFVNPQRTAFPLVPCSPERWRAPSGSANTQFFAVLDQMGARHQAVNRRDHLILALEDARAAKLNTTAGETPGR